MVNVKISLENFEYDFENLKICFPEAPQKGDFISLFNLLPYHTEVRNVFFSKIDEMKFDFVGEIVKRRWTSDNPNEEPHLLIYINLNQRNY